MKRWLWVYSFILPFLFNNPINSTILLYNTDNRQKTQAYDCINYDESVFNEYINPETTQTVKYCIQSNEYMSINRDYSRGCSNEGVLISFEKLKQLNISIEELFKWNSGVNVVDRYQAYLKLNKTTEDFICNCTKSGTFGILCEYQFSHNTFEETIEYQFNLKKTYPIGSQLYGTTTCYNTSFECDYGKRCLDWRHICDRKQQCVDGKDEEYCEQLLFNECNSDTEYRCRNGMCIDEEYFLDGDIDCQDSSDEQADLLDEFRRYCPFVPNMECDERLPYTKQFFSCGDGEVIYEQALILREIFPTLCQSFRDKQWMCELDYARKMWTNPENGHCLDIIDNTTDIQQEENDCIFLLKCALTGTTQNYACPCSGNNCRSYFFLTCDFEKTSLYNYPNDGVIAPFVRTVYDLKLHDFKQYSQPDYYFYINSIKCNSELRAIPDDIYMSSYMNIRIYLTAFPWPSFEYLFCDMYRKKHPHQQINVHCWNDTYPNQAVYCVPDISFECISKKQINDGVSDCQLMQDELLVAVGNCSSIQKHRYRCLNRNTSCFTVLSIENGMFQCFPYFSEEALYEIKRDLADRKCKSNGSDDCRFIRQYILQSTLSSSFVNTTNITKNIEKAIHFWSYCDSIWDIDYGTDEINCYQWKCHPDFLFYQCKSGQCIPFDWLCNGEWDCSDGSDEEGFQLLTDHTLSEYNFQIFQQVNSNLEKQKQKCLNKNSQQPFQTICNHNFEYSCLLANVSDPLNFLLNRPCINLTQLGDGYIDCYGGLDERNILNCSSYSQLGFNFKCENSDECQPALVRCASDYRCPNNENRFICFQSLNSTQIDNSTLIDMLVKDVFFSIYCLDGLYVSDGRCNNKPECKFGEDELYCGLERINSLAPQYRKYVYNTTDLIFKIILSNYIPSSSIINKDKQNDQNLKLIESNEQPIHSFVEISQENARKYSQEGWICNRGILAWKNSSNNNQLEIQCFCPPSYYGKWCQWMSDRITIFTHFQSQTNYYLSKNVIKILALFIITMNNRPTILDHHEYHFTPALQNLNKKHKFYFIYPRPHQLRLNTSSYSIRFEAYLLNDDKTIQFLAVWVYSIPFHFLPSQRLAKILKYIHQPQLNTDHVCSSINNPCSVNRGKCHPLMNKLNDINSYWCECTNKSYGSHCQFKDQSYMTPCSSTSLYRPKYDQNEEKPLCICSVNFYGPGCYLSQYCQINKDQNPCLNGGKCIDNYHHYSSKHDFFCQCPQNYFGLKCEQNSAIIEMLYNSPNQSLNYSNHQILVLVIQLFDMNDKQDLLLRQQTVHNKNLPLNSKLIYNDYILPIFGLIKLYTNKSFIRYHLLYTTTINERSFNLTIILNEQNHCPHTSEIFQQYNKTSKQLNLPAKYHTLCDRSTHHELLCFRDDNYFCLCDINNYTQCFIYNQKWDQCQHCLAQGYCIGDEKLTRNYSCICPQCYYGERCQYNTQVLSFTLESLFRKNLLSSSSVEQKVSFSMYIFAPVFLFIYGIVNNLFSFVTFRRPKPRLNGVGHYLFMSSIVSQFSLLFLIMKIVYILIGIQGIFSHTITSLILCKTLSFSLSSSTRIYYWLTSFVTIERLYVTKYPKGMWFKQPKIAKRIIFLIFLLTLASHIHELIQYTIVDNHTYIDNETWCVTQYSQSLNIYNQANTFIHYVIPFVINFICTIYLTILIVRSRATIDKKKTRSQIFYEHIKKKKEIFVPSIMIILSALPQFIISFSLACTDLDMRWERYLLIIAFFFSYTPQILTFHLYVQPSTFFLTEFYSTNMGSSLKERMKIRHINK